MIKCIKNIKNKVLNTIVQPENGEQETDSFEEPEVEKPVHVETPEEIEEREILMNTIDRRHTHRKRYVWMAVAAVVLAFVGWIWFYFSVPYVNEARESGYITKVSYEGLVFKTYEGLMLSERFVNDRKVRLTGDFHFTIESDSLANKIVSYQGTGQKVHLTYKAYRGRLFWRGDNNVFVTEITPVEE